MKINFINKINKEYNSLTTLKLGDEEFPLTEKELSELLRSFYNMRQDVFESEGLLENEDDKKGREELEDEIERLKEIIDDIRYSADYD